MPSKCSDHPEKDSFQICDSCNRFLCRDCIEEIKWFPGRVFHYCYRKSCNAAFLNKARKWLTGFGVFMLVFLILIVALSIRAVRERDLLELASHALILAINIPTFSMLFGILSDYRRRKANPGSHPS